ncbi:major facilitator superfamily domain-containing protein [Immersiella caudata]|uniref:Major facilitator superfamily domain-containing protein n=1 Tax=Immersiella caudata TaxID=314043 RepID=A0AA40BU67_9PEZI|nr:major facilitator superfamily domain-containing protein [Immersiella caudata]
MSSGDPETRDSPSTEKGGYRPSTSSTADIGHRDDASAHGSSSQTSITRNRKPATGGLAASKKLANPLSGLSRERLGAMGEDYARLAGLTSEDDLRAFRLGAMISGGNTDYNSIPGLTDREREVLERETTHKWSQPRMLYWVIIISSLCAAVQGMDETVVNGAQSFYKHAFGIGTNSERDTWLLGLTNSAPHLCCAFIGCWLTDPLNKKFGRRGTIFITCSMSALACFWQAFTNTWWHMFLARFALGFGIGPKSATTPIFAAECSPPRLRGALVMLSDLDTNLLGLSPTRVAMAEHGIEPGLNWRLMMGSAMLPAIVVCCLAYICPESPRWYLSKNRHKDAFDSVRQLRYEKVQAARDLFYMHTLLDAEKEVMSVGKANRLKEMFTIRRNRNAMIASETVMFLQQFCGISVIGPPLPAPPRPFPTETNHLSAYYSSGVFLEANFSEVSALSASLGFGIINWLFALPAFYTIDTYGRRNLLLATFSLMSLFLFSLASLFGFLSPPMLTLPASPSASTSSPLSTPPAYPLYIRPIGMSLATVTTWFFNFILAATWPSLLSALKPQGAFSWYAAWNNLGFFMVLFLVPETKDKTLEELDAVFDVPLRSTIKHGAKQAVYFWGHVVMRGDVRKPELPHVKLAREVGEGIAEKERREARGDDRV